LKDIFSCGIQFKYLGFIPYIVAGSLVTVIMFVLSGDSDQE